MREVLKVLRPAGVAMLLAVPAMAGTMDNAAADNVHAICRSVVGVTPGSTEAVACSDSLMQTMKGRAFETAADFTGLQHPSRPFVESRAEERRAREEQACTRLKLTPGSPAYGDCVSELGLALDFADNTSG